MRPFFFHQIFLLLQCLYFANFSFRYRIVFQTSNVLGRKSEYAVDNFSMSPQCFGLGVESKDVGDWRYNMTDLQFCKYYGKKVLKAIYSFWLIYNFSEIDQTVAIARFSLSSI